MNIPTKMDKPLSPSTPPSSSFKTSSPLKKIVEEKLFLHEERKTNSLDKKVIPLSERQESHMNVQDPKSVSQDSVSITSWLIYQVSLQFNRLVAASWWNAVVKIGEAEIFLGALPLDRHYGIKKEYDSEILTEKHQIRAVLSLVEAFENNSHGFFTSTVTHEDWEKKGVEHLQLPTPDFHPIKKEDLDRGTDFIHKNVTVGNNVYVHCKAGKGRSALMLACYLVRYQGHSKKTALELIQSKRNQMHLNEIQFYTLSEYEKGLTT